MVNITVWRHQGSNPRVLFKDTTQRDIGRNAWFYCDSFEVRNSAIYFTSLFTPIWMFILIDYILVVLVDLHINTCSISLSLSLSLSLYDWVHFHKEFDMSNMEKVMKRLNAIVEYPRICCGWYIWYMTLLQAK